MNLKPNILAAIGNTLEGRLRGTNVRHKSYFPQQACEAYGTAQGRRIVTMFFPWESQS